MGLLTMKRALCLYTALMVSMLMLPLFAYAYEIRDVAVDAARDDFVLEPAKIEIFLDPGASRTETLRITNRTDGQRTFSIDVEDFQGSRDIAQTVELLGEQTGPYSLKDYITPEIETFTLEPKQQIILDVTVDIPEDADPGGLYGSILVSSVSKGTINGNGVAAVSRLGALLFVRVSGDVVEDGYLKELRIAGGKRFFTNAEDLTSFELYFENNGSVHLNPYGVIQVSNIAGMVVDDIEVVPYFAMPDSLRYRNVPWSRELLLGRYKVTAEINRGYDDIVDELSLVFWVIPWKIIIFSLFGVALLLLAVRWIGRTFKIERRS